MELTNKSGFTRREQREGTNGSGGREDSGSIGTFSIRAYLLRSSSVAHRRDSDFPERRQRHYVTVVHVCGNKNPPLRRAERARNCDDNDRGLRATSAVRRRNVCLVFLQFGASRRRGRRRRRRSRARYRRFIGRDAASLTFKSLLR